MTYKGRIIHVDSNGNKYPVAQAQITVTPKSGNESIVKFTNSNGYIEIELPDAIDIANTTIVVSAFGVSTTVPSSLYPPTPNEPFEFWIDLGLSLNFPQQSAGVSKTAVTAEQLTTVTLGSTNSNAKFEVVRWNVRPQPEMLYPYPDQNAIEFVVPRGTARLYAEAVLKATSPKQPDTGGSGQGVGQGGWSASALPASTYIGADTYVVPAPVNSVSVSGPVSIQEPVGVRLLRTASEPTLDQALWSAIENRTHAISFNRYQDFMNRALNWEERSYNLPANVDDPKAQQRIQRDLSDLGTDLYGVRAYQALKGLTETFLLLECGVRIDPKRPKAGSTLQNSNANNTFVTNNAFGVTENQAFTPALLEDKLKAYLHGGEMLPYIARVVRNVFPEISQEDWTGRLIGSRINEPCLIELIWSYWMEQGMLVQTMNAICQRFQNVRPCSPRGVMFNLDIDPLRPLSNLLFGFIQDSPNRLTALRRSYAYVDSYGDEYRLHGRATRGMHPADTRSQFSEAFNNLLIQTSIFYKEDFQTTVIADGFPLLNALKDVHMILAEGNHNQANDVPFISRAEMLLIQYFLGRRECRDFLPGRLMIPYKEGWEAQVDAMKTLQGWTDVSVSHFRDLAVYGEQILLAIRYGDWIGVNNEDSAKNWARFFRSKIQAYMHSYRAVTGIDLTMGDTIEPPIPTSPARRRTSYR